MKANELLKEWLDEGGRKQGWLAKQVGASDGAMTQWIKGNQIPLPYFRAQLAGVTGLPIASKDAWE